MSTTTKYALPYPELTDGPDGADVPYWVKLLAQALDVLVVSYSSGLAAGRPVSTAGSPGKSGRIYRSTDTGAIELDYGTGWVSMGALPPWGTADYGALSVTDAKIASMDGSKLVALSVPTGALADKLVTAAKIADALKPSAGAGAATEALRALGTSAGTALAGNASAGGDLTGTYPNPTIAALAVTDAKVAAANKDGAAGTASMRTLGTGAAQAAAGNDSRFPGRAPVKKTASVTVNTTVTETDLLAGALDLSANDLGSSRKAKITCWGDMKNNSGGIVALPRFKFKLGGTTLIDTGAPAGVLAADAVRRGWKIEIEILELGATNAQLVAFDGKFALLQAQAVSLSAMAFTTGEGNWGGSEGPTGGAKAQLAEAFGVNTGALDSTTALAIVLSVINGSANANMETKLLGAVLEIV